MNDAVKEYIRKVKRLIVEGLETNFPTLLLYEDEVPQEETTAYDNGAPYFLMVLKMGAINKQDDVKFLSQDFTIDFYCENRDDVDEIALDLISILKVIPSVTYSSSQKFRARHSDTNRFVDIVTLQFKRGMKLEC
ncbi:hypothetical protein [Psychrobacillus phage Spoks]|nr:hypothetical protein [Psychrobacillus phage Spoks]